MRTLLIWQARHGSLSRRPFSDAKAQGARLMSDEILSRLAVIAARINRSTADHRARHIKAARRLIASYKIGDTDAAVALGTRLAAEIREA